LVDYENKLGANYPIQTWLDGTNFCYIQL